MEQRERNERTENRLETDLSGNRAAAEADGVKSSVKDESGRKAWDTFAASGKIQDYLIYRRSGLN